MFGNNNNINGTDTFGTNGFRNNGQVVEGGIPFPSGGQDMSNLGGVGNGFGGYPQQSMQGYVQQPNPFTPEPLLSGFNTDTTGIKNKNTHISNVLVMLFGEGYSFNAVKVPEDEVFPERIRHFDRTGFSYLNTQSGTYQSVGIDGRVVNVTVTYAVCQACRKVYYRVDGIY